MERHPMAWGTYTVHGSWITVYNTDVCNSSASRQLPTGNSSPIAFQRRNRGPIHNCRERMSYKISAQIIASYAACAYRKRKLMYCLLVVGVAEVTGFVVLCTRFWCTE